MNTFQNIERPDAPQTVTIEFVRGETHDDSPDLSWLTQSYNDVENEGERIRYQDQDAARLADYERGRWHMRGLFVTARISVPIGQGSFALYEIRSPGLWGVESDCGPEYELETWRDQENELRAHLKAMSVAFAALPDTVQS